PNRCCEPVCHSVATRSRVAHPSQSTAVRRAGPLRTALRWGIGRHTLRHRSCEVSLGQPCVRVDNWAGLGATERAQCAPCRAVVGSPGVCPLSCPPPPAPPPPFPRTKESLNGQARTVDRSRHGSSVVHGRAPERELHAVGTGAQPRL